MERGLARRMLISGVARTVRPEELAEAYEVDPALFECCIALGREAFDTRSNADEVARWLARRRFRSIRLVTNDLHMPRARYELRKRDRRRRHHRRRRGPDRTRASSRSSSNITNICSAGPPT